MAKHALPSPPSTEGPGATGGSTRPSPSSASNIFLPFSPGGGRGSRGDWPEDAQTRCTPQIRRMRQDGAQRRPQADTARETA